MRYVDSELLLLCHCMILKIAIMTDTHAQVLQIMLPLRYDFLSFGGSWAQRQVFSTTIIQSAINANKLQLAFELVSELKVCCIHDHDYFLLL